MLRFVAAASVEPRPSRIVDSSGPGSAGQGRVPGRVRAACFAPLLGYWILVTAIIINPQLQWSLAVLGPILVLMAWLIVLRDLGPRCGERNKGRRKSMERRTDGVRGLQESRGASIGRRAGRVIPTACNSKSRSAASWRTIE
jgi:hypothetical protein